jgi:hypothetical protein
MRRLLLLSVAVLAVSGCARIFDGSTQRVTIETPGAEGAACFLENEEFRYKLYAPQTITMTKTRKPLHVRCLAPGNRQKEIIVTPEIEESAKWNALNLGVGAVADYESFSLYRLPDKIVVDFRDMEPKGMPTPKYDRFLRKHPELRGYEEFRPGLPALQRDMYDTPTPLRRRELPGGNAIIDDDAGGGGEAADVPATTSSSASSLSSSSSSSSGSAYRAPAYSGGGNADSLTRQMNPQVFGGGTSAPAVAPPSGGFAGGTSADEAAGYPLPLMR